MGSRYIRKFGLVLLLASGCFAHFATAEDCASLVQPARATVQHWAGELLRAHQDHNAEGEVYALLRMGLDTADVRTPSDWNRQNQRVARQLAMDLELSSLAKDIGVAPASRILEFFGLSYLFQHRVYGTSPQGLRAQRSKTVKAIASDLFFTLGPQFSSLFKLRKLRRTWRVDLLNLQFALMGVAENTGVFSALAKADDVSNSIARADLLRRIRGVMTDDSLVARRTWVLGRALVPWLVAGAISVNAGTYPFDYASSTIQKSLPYGYQPYLGSEYLADATRQIGPINHGRLLIAYHDYMMKEVDNRQNPPMGVLEFHAMNSGNVDTFRFKKLQDLQNANLQSYDNVIIFTHGLPDEMSGDLNNTKFSHPMKKGANLVLFSCLVAQQGGRDEAWVRFSQSLLNGGKAVASTAMLLAYVAPAYAGPELSTADAEEHRITNEIVSGFEFGFNMLGIEQAVMVKYGISWALYDQYFFAPKGIRVLDSATGKVTYFSSQPDSQ